MRSICVAWTVRNLSYSVDIHFNKIYVNEWSNSMWWSATLIRTDKRSGVLTRSINGDYVIGTCCAAPRRELLCSLCVLCVVIGDDSVTSSDRHVIKPSWNVQLGGCGRWQLMIGRRRSLDTDTPLDHLLSTVKLIVRRRHTDAPAAASCDSVFLPSLS